MPNRPFLTSFFGLIVMLLLAQSALAQTTRIVSDINPGEWLIGPFTVGEAGPPSTEFVSGPGAPGAGTGSYRAQILESGSKIILLRNDYHDIRLDRLQELSFWTFVPTGSNENNWYINLYVDKDGDGFYDTRLDYVPPTGDLVRDTWQQWDAMDPGSLWNVNTGGSMTIADFIDPKGGNPDARINAFNTPIGGALRFNQGDTAATYVGFDGYLDGVRVKVSAAPSRAADDDDTLWNFTPRTAIAVQSVAVTADTPTPTDNDYTRINNAVLAMVAGDTVTLEGTFDWAEPNAAASWELGSDGIALTDDDFSILVPPLNDGTITAANLGDARIQGPGDLADANLEGVFVLYDGEFRGWTFSNLEIFDFDLSIAMFFNGGTLDSFDDVTVTNNHFRMPTDRLASEGDANQNIAIHFAFGDLQTISDNLIEIPGDSASDTGMGEFAASVAMQSNTAGAISAYDGLRITGNQIHILNAPAADPEFIYGIWENGGSHGADIEVSGNEFVNLSPLNDPAANLQRAFRIHSQSAPLLARGVEAVEEEPSVRYNDNLVVGANIGFKWIEGFGSDWDFTPHGPVLMRGNTILGSGTGVAVRSGGEARLRCNRITGNTVGVSGITAGGSGAPIEYEDAEAIDAANNWWGCNQGPDMGPCDTTDGFAPIDLSSWFELSATSPMTSLEAGGSAPVLADLASNAATAPSCAFPDGATAFFDATNGSMSPEEAAVVAGVTMSTFTAGGENGGIALVTVDNQTVPVAFAIDNDETDLAIDKTSDLAVVDVGNVVTYTIEVTNLGPSNVTGATVTDAFSAELTDCSWTCVDSSGASCGAKGGLGDINDTADLDVGSMLTYTATCTYSPAGAPVDVSNSATVTVPGGITDLDMGNNEDSDFLPYAFREIFADGFESGDTTAWASTP